MVITAAQKPRASPLHGLFEWHLCPRRIAGACSTGQETNAAVATGGVWGIGGGRDGGHRGAIIVVRARTPHGCLYLVMACNRFWAASTIP